VPRLKVASPNGQIVFILGDAKASQALEPGVNDLRYAVDFRGKWLMDESVLGLKLEGQPALGPGMKQVGVQTSRHDETYTIPVGQDQHACAIITTRHVADFVDRFRTKALDRSPHLRRWSRHSAIIVPDQPSVDNRSASSTS
jgi:hypothetical protein